MNRTLNPTEKSQISAAFISLLVACVVLAMKLTAYFQTRSLAILSDALETIVNVVAAVVALVVIYVVAKPADEDHPYGHGKAEYFSAAFEGGLIFSAAALIIYESIKSFFVPKQFDHILDGAAWIMGATLLNLFVGLYLKKIASTSKSHALSASAAHVLSDVKSTAGVIVGVLIVHFTGLQWVDSLTAFAMGLLLLVEGYKIVRTSISGLTDEVDIEALNELTLAFEKNRRPEIIDIHRLKQIRSGRFHHVDAHVVVPEYWDIREVHELTNAFEKDVVKDYPYDGEIAFHLDPCQRKYCTQCNVTECKIRARPFEFYKKFETTMLIQEGM